LEKNYDQYHTTIKIENELSQIEKDVLQSKYNKLSAIENIGVDDNDQEVASKIEEYIPNNKLSRFNRRKFYFSTVIVCLVLLGLLFILVFFGEFLPF
jgi:ABC-type lipoprotein release transport system permease subunit